MRKFPFLSLNVLTVLCCLSCGTPSNQSASSLVSQSLKDLTPIPSQEVELEKNYLEYRDNGGGLSFGDWQKYTRGEIADSRKSNPEPSSGAPNNLIKVWCPFHREEAVKRRAKAFVDKFNQTSNDRKFNVETYQVETGQVGSLMAGKAAEQVDVYFFYTNQLSLLVDDNAITRLNKPYRESMLSSYDDSSALGVKCDHDYYGFPVAKDSGLFLYYDASKISQEEASNWESLVARAEKDGLEIDYQYTNAWYTYGFFSACGAESKWKTAGLGKFSGYEDNLNSEAGLDALRALSKVIRSESVALNQSIYEINDKCAALVSGYWDYEGALEKWGANARCVELPYFTTNDGRRIHTESMYLGIMMGVKPQGNDPVRETLLMDLAKHLASPEAQMEYFLPEDLSQCWLPCSEEAITKLNIANTKPHYMAMFKQNKHARPQGEYPKGWWDAAGNMFGNPIKAAQKVDDAFLKQLLSAYESSLAKIR